MDYDSDDGEERVGGAEAASVGAPVLAASLQQAYDLVAKAGPPVFELCDGVYYLAPKDTLFGTYAPVHAVDVVDGKLYVTCRLPKDGGSLCNARTRVDCKGKAEWSNVMSHLRSVHKAFVRPEHRKQTAEEAAASVSVSGSAAPAAIAIVTIACACVTAAISLPLSLGGVPVAGYRLSLSLTGPRRGQGAWLSPSRYRRRHSNDEDGGDTGVYDSLPGSPCC
jgi:hypothetical protein